MRRTSWAAVCVVLASSIAPALAPAEAGPTAGGLASDNVEHVRHIPLSTNGVGGRLIGKYFYTNDQNKVMIFDVSTPENPELTGVLPMPQEWQFSREDLDGNGKILVIPNTVTGRLYIVDVEDKSNPTIIAELPGAASHTSSCILDCKWVYNSSGAIIDLRDPAEPKLRDEAWGDDLQAKNGHDVSEIKKGLVVTGTQPIQFVDARKDPLHPRLLATGANEDRRFIHGVQWPRQGKDRFLLVAGETTFNFRCSENSAAFMTWDASRWRKTHTFTMIDEHRVTNGMIADGRPVAQRNCSSHWHDAHPDFRNGGLVAAAFYDHGTRFFDVNRKGKIEEVGWFYPYAGQTSAAYWITDEIVYAVDYNRGIDILRFKPTRPELV